jgi:hypothetical protein
LAPGAFEGGVVPPACSGPDPVIECLRGEGVRGQVEGGSRSRRASRRAGRDLRIVGGERVKKQNAKAAHGSNGELKVPVVVKADAQRKRTGLMTWPGLACSGRVAVLCGSAHADAQRPRHHRWAGPKCHY